MPTTTAWPPRPMSRGSISIVAGAPMASKGVGGSEFACQREALVGEVDRDDGVGADQAQAEQNRLSDASTAEHYGGIARTDARRVSHGADAGGHRAADQRGDREGDVFRNRHGCGLRYDRLLGEGAEAEKGANRRSIPAEEASRPIRQHVV